MVVEGGSQWLDGSYLKLWMLDRLAEQLVEAMMELSQRLRPLVALQEWLLEESYRLVVQLECCLMVGFTYLAKENKGEFHESHTFVYSALV